MDSEIKVEVLEKEAIKPSSPTPPDLRSLSLSVFDQVVPECYVPLLLFYPSTTEDEVNTDLHSLAAERSSLLKTSLSTTLTHFYPFAGKFDYNLSICCDDHGAAFLHAQGNCTLSKILEEPDCVVLDQLLPTYTISKEEVSGYVLLVQVTVFECGGMSIGANFSHKASDAFTVSAFMNRWAAVAHGFSTTDDIVLPATEFGVATSVYPPLDLLSSRMPIGDEVYNKEKCVTKRYVFEASRIDALKSKLAASSMVTNPTRVEVVSALIYKCAIEASRSNSLSSRPSVWCQAVNMRRTLRHPMSLMGNLVGISFAEEGQETEVTHQRLVAKIREGTEKFKVKFGGGISSEGVCEIYNEFGKLLHRDDIDVYTCSSWCRFPFYHVNFGWGEPSWVTTSPPIEIKNIIELLDTKDGDGIVATMRFKEEDMALIETNEEFLAYASWYVSL